ncbi:MAG: hypothetical protein QOH83_276 [Solirubrobacteraceae bacterium]|nr:hypothetical protein [Solirubrobacteraceae bacterium]
MRCDIDVRDGRLSYRGPLPGEDPAEVALTATRSEFELARLAPAAAPVYYRLGRGRLEMSDDLRAFRPAGPQPAPDHGVLLAMIHGLPDAPNATALPGVQELTVGDRLRVDHNGVSVLRRPPRLTPGAPLQRAISQVLAQQHAGEIAIAYSGGLASTFLAVSARSAGRRPELFHADLNAGASPLPEIPGTGVHRVDCDLFELLDLDQISGQEISPPLPDTALRRRMMARLHEASGTALASGALLETLVATTLPEVAAARLGRRLLACEPFHRDGTIATLRDARAMLAANGAGMRKPRVAGAEQAESESQEVGAPPPTPSEHAGLPGLTEAGREALKSARLATGAVWRTHLDDLPTAIGRVEAARHEAGLPGPLHDVAVAALDSRVLAAIAALPARRLGRVRGGRFVNQAPLRDCLARAGVGPVREASSGFRVRLAAAAYVHRERRALAAALACDCALADLGLLDPRPLLRLLRDGQATADRALMLLRLIWLDHWLRRR